MYRNLIKKTKNLYLTCDILSFSRLARSQAVLWRARVRVVTSPSLCALAACRTATRDPKRLTSWCRVISREGEVVIAMMVLREVVSHVFSHSRSFSSPSISAYVSVCLSVSLSLSLQVYFSLSPSVCARMCMYISLLTITRIPLSLTHAHTHPSLLSSHLPCFFAWLSASTTDFSSSLAC